MASVGRIADFITRPFGWVHNVVPPAHSRTTKKVIAIAAAISLFALASIPKAEAFLGFFALCMSTCLTATAGFGAPACAAACSATLAAPI